MNKSNWSLIFERPKRGEEEEKRKRREEEEEEEEEKKKRSHDKKGMELLNLIMDLWFV